MHYSFRISADTTAYEDLQRYYNNAKAMQTDFTICFSNTDAQPSITASFHASVPGGRHSLQNPVSAQESRLGPILEPVNAYRGEAVSEFQTQPDQADPIRRHLPPSRPRPRSILRTGVPRQSHKRVHFAKMHCIRSFPDPVKAMNVRLSESKESTVKLSSGECFVSDDSVATALDTAWKALVDNSLDDLIAELQSGKIGTHHCRNGKNFFDDALARTKSSGVDKRIRALLKIYKLAGNSILVAQNLKSLQEFRIEILKVSGCVPTDGGEGLDTIQGTLYVSVDGRENAQKKPIPPMTSAQEVDYGAGNAALPSYTIHFNPGKRGQV